MEHAPDTCARAASALARPLALAALAALTLAACAGVQTDWQYQPAQDHIGRIHVYERSNSDGSMEERISVFRRDATHIEVLKQRARCWNAALVTAELDFDTFSAPIITGGRLQPNAEHMEFAFLNWDQDADQLNIIVRFPDGELVNEAPVLSTPWHLFDFDLASLTAMTPHLANRDAGFDFGMALVWADPGAADPLIWMGDLHAEPAARESRLGHDSRRYVLTGSALDGEMATADTGSIWLDATAGHIVEAIIPAPNHPGYTDFRLRLLEINDGGAAEWTRRLTAHFEGCEG